MVPRDEVEAVVDQCARRGVRALIVVSSGFAEAGDEGRAKQLALVEKVRGYGMRLLGPNCLGVINTDPEVRLNASLSAEVPARGRVALSSQSGAIGMTLLQLARRRNLGVSMFISMGNKADVTGNDLLYFWEDDPSTDVILLYLESFGNPRRFGRIAREVSRRKPIVCVKSGRYRASPEEHAVAALFDQTGVIRADSLEDMFDIATLLGAQPLPAGERVGIITNSRGAGVLCADACAAAGLNRAGTEPLLDLTANATPDDYQHALAKVLAAPDRDAAIVIYTPVLPSPTGPVLDAIAHALAGLTDSAARKPVVLVMMTESTGATVIRQGDHTFPVYPFPERAADTLAAAARYRAWREAPPGLMPAFTDLDPTVLRELLNHQTPSPEGSWLDRDAAERLLAAAGIRCGSRPGPDAVSVELEVNEDPLFGPVMNVSLAGYHRDVLGDIAYRMVPLTDREAEAMVRSIRGYPLLKDHGADLAALQELILRLSQLIEALPEITAVRLAPVQVAHDGGGCLIGNPLIRISATP